MFKLAFVGAGRRAQSAHYPTVNRVENSTIEAVAELDEIRMGEVVDEYDIPRTFGDYREMIEVVDPDVVYIVMGQEVMTSIAVECMNAGKHVFIEKPAGASPEESNQLLESAKSNDVICAVGYQRRFASVTTEAMKLVKEKGGATLAVGEFHKNLLGTPEPIRSTMWDDICHIVDLVRFMVGSEVKELNGFRDMNGSNWINDYSALIKFESGATGALLANRSSGGRTLRAELHGIGIGCYMQIPEQIEIFQDNSNPAILTGGSINKSDAGRVHDYDGTMEMHNHLISSIQKGQIPINDIRDVVHTSNLVASIEGV
tara:strand:+ start:16991 stop:17935 length:945 start_codon:yes stop_codon:yes gene_type:complete